MKPLLAFLITLGTAVMLTRFSTPRVVRAQDTCTSASLRGGYGYTFSGATVDVASYAAAGRLVADGQGKLYGAETESLDGDIFQRNYTGTYVVNADCTGSEYTNDDYGTTTRCDFVIFAGGREVQVIEADAGTVIVGRLKHQ